MDTYVTAVASTKAWGVAWDSSNDRIWAFGPWNLNMTVVNAATHTVVNTFNTGTTTQWQQDQLAYDPLSHTMYLDNQGGGTVVPINTATYAVGTGISTGISHPMGIVYDPYYRYIYAVDGSGGKIGVINATTNTSLGYVSGTANQAICYDPHTKEVYALDDAGDVTPINNTTAGSVWSVGSFYFEARNPAGAA
jgi:YVTN family beta-propeller protein